MTNNSNITIKSYENNYEVFFIDDFKKKISELLKIKNCFLVIDKKVFDLHIDNVRLIIEAMPYYLIDATEETKSFDGVLKILNFLQENNAIKKSTLLAIGGGIIHDIAAFAAHIYYRGVDFMFMPTTLLAMSDVCIGGKCGINFNTYKNQVGAIHTPKSVFIWPGFLNTLSQNDIYSGYGEIVKSSIISSNNFYQNVKQTLYNQGVCNNQTKNHIYKSLLTKKIYVEQDEFEKDSRRILNYGHTFGHAIEAITNYNVAHGIAVIKGIDIANYISFRKSILDKSVFEDIHNLIKKNFSIEQIKFSPEILLNQIARDKKAFDDGVNVILPKSVGNVIIEKLSFDCVLEMLNDYLNDFC
jgi:3-dehydroquinate synthase